MTDQQLHMAMAIKNRISELECKKLDAEKLQELYENGGDLEMVIKVNGSFIEVEHHHMPVDMYKFFKDYIGYVSADLVQEQKDFEDL